MTQYLLSVHMVEGQEAYPPRRPCSRPTRRSTPSTPTSRPAARWVFAGGLHPPTTATVVRTDSGETVITDGPFAETKEQLGGFWIVDVADLDAALDLAAKGSVACGGPVEVRPFQELPED